VNFKQAVSLVEMVCEVAGSRDIINDARRNLRQAGVLKAVQEHDDRAIFDWLMEAVSYQGISDAAAASYMEVHGTASALDMAAGLQAPPCLKLTSYWSFNGCGYRKAKRTCSRPSLLDKCPLPQLDLRNGSLNQAAYSLYLFMRDVAGDDFVNWIDERLNRTSTAGRDGATALIEPLSQIHGLSWKTLSMSLATLLLAGDPKRDLWKAVGADMIAIDTLVHNWLHRTGILRGLDAEHCYGPACYADRNCSEIIREVALMIDGRAFNIEYPAIFPRLVQQAIWRFCAQQHFNQCNGNRIDDRGRCWQSDCILFDNCARLKLDRITPLRTASETKA
jgi:hypothetical protein